MPAWVKVGSSWKNGAGGSIITRDNLVAGVDQPTLGNTGVFDGVVRTNYTGGAESSLPSDTYTNLNFVNGEINLVNGRTYFFSNCLFASSGQTFRLIDATAAGSWSATFEDCTFQPNWASLAHADNNTSGGHSLAALAFRGHHLTIRRCQFRDLNDAIDVGSITGPTSVIFEQNYIDNFTYWRPDQNGRVEGTHNDGIVVDSGTGTIIRGNTIYGYNNPAIGDAAMSQYTGTDGRLHGLQAEHDPEQWIQGACIFVRPTAQTVSVDGTIIDRNWLYGSELPIHVSRTNYTGVTLNTQITGNRFGTVGTPDGGMVSVNILFHGASYNSPGTVYSGNLQANGSPAVLVLS